MALSTKAKGRLKTLIEYMRGLPKAADDHFNMRWWVLHNGDSKGVAKQHGLGGGITKQKLLSCGTAACAAGWAATIPQFKRAGFKMEMDEFGRLSPAIAPDDFFDINAIQVDQLFSGSNVDETPRAWAKRAKELVKQWSKARD